MGKPLRVTRAQAAAYARNTERAAGDPPVPFRRRMADLLAAIPGASLGYEEPRGGRVSLVVLYVAPRPHATAAAGIAARAECFAAVLTACASADLPAERHRGGGWVRVWDGAAAVPGTLWEDAT